jgi:acetate---CoA ligase (ADP-forming) subunit beta
MGRWPQHPVIYEINTWVWLEELRAKHDATVTLASVPEEEWDAIASLGFDAVWFMGVWERSPAGVAIANQNTGLVQDFQRADDRAATVSPKGRSVFSDIIEHSTTTVLDELQCKRVMKEYGIMVTEPVLAWSEAAALAAAEKIGFPVAMKIVSPQITHKSDIGGVVIGLTGPADISRAYAKIMAAAAVKAPQAVVEGVSLQKMAPSGTEVAIGMTKDPQFGPVVMFGLGGTLVEVLKDVAFSIVPLSKGDANQMIKEIRAYPLLEGYRGQPGVDIEHIEELLLKVSRLVEENPEIREMDINPLIAYADGAIAVDARIILEDGVVEASGR